MRRFLVLGCFLFTGLLAMLAPAPAAATVRYVASNGVNTPACGTLAAPCRSISKALARSVAGDRIIVGPGFYGDLNRDGNFLPPNDEAPDPVSGSVISITKAVTVESSGGAAVTVIGTPPDWKAVRITAPGVVVRRARQRVHRARDPGGHRGQSR